MGQYYNPINIDKREYLYSHNFGSGLKLMEHSHIGNDFVEAVEVLLTEFGPWHKDRIVWAGDYANGETKQTIPDTFKEFVDFSQKPEYETHININHLVGIDNEPLAPYEIHKIRDDNNIDLKEYQYIVNHTRGVVVDKNKLKEFNEEGMKVHPLPLLTAEGNGRGGGDYHEEQSDYESVGLWARDSISIEKERPEGYTEEQFNFEGY